MTSKKKAPAKGTLTDDCNGCGNKKNGKGSIGDTAAGSDPETLARQEASAAREMWQKDNSGALALIEEAVQLDPGALDDSLWCTLGILRFTVNSDAQNARIALLNAQEQNPRLWSIAPWLLLCIAVENTISEDRATLVKILGAVPPDSRKNFYDAIMKIEPMVTKMASGMSLLEYLALLNLTEYMTFLLNLGVPVDLQDETEGNTALHVAAGFNKAEAVELLLKRGIDVNVINNHGNTPLAFMAALDGKPEIAETLLEAGADPNLADRKELTPLLLAAGHSNAPLVELLLKHGADVNAADPLGMTPLHAVVVASPSMMETTAMVETALILLEAGADPNMPDSMGVTPMIAAEERGFDTIVEFLRM